MNSIISSSIIISVHSSQIKLYTITTFNFKNVLFSKEPKQTTIYHFKIINEKQYYCGIKTKIYSFATNYKTLVEITLNRVKNTIKVETILAKSNNNCV